MPYVSVVQSIPVEPAPVRLHRAPEMQPDWVPTHVDVVRKKFKMSSELSVSELDDMYRMGHEPFSFDD